MVIKIPIINVRIHAGINAEKPTMPKPSSAIKASEIMNEQGWGEHYMHMGLGHSIGLDVHENPWIRPGFDEPIRTNMCFTLEPKIWKRGEFYVRCEDVVVVGPDGARSLTKFHYEPNIIS